MSAKGGYRIYSCRALTITAATCLYRGINELMTSRQAWSRACNFTEKFLPGGNGIGGITVLDKLFIFAMALAVFAMPDSVLDTAQQTEMVAAHNRWRKEVGAPAVKWSTELASKAQAWADHLRQTRGCSMVHSRSAGLGENLYWASPQRWSSGKTEEQAISPADVVNSWAQEKKDYEYRTNACATGKVCGHYTQLVSSKTTEVGCGKAICSDKSQVWVCNYNPPGNIIGQKPY